MRICKRQYYMISLALEEVQVLYEVCVIITVESIYHADFGFVDGDILKTLASR